MARKGGLVAGAACTMDPDQPLLSPAYVGWDGGTLVEIRPPRSGDLDADGVHDRHDALVLPGFVNVHHHVTSAGLTGVEPEAQPGLGAAPPEARRRFVAAIDQDRSRALAALGFLELARAGVTTTTDSQAAWKGDRRVDGAIEAAASSGLRVHFSAAFLDRTELIPPQQQHTPDGAVQELDRLRNLFAGDRLEIEGEPLSLPRATDDLVRALHGARHRRAAMHLTYSRAFERWADETLGRRAVEHLDHLGVLDAGWLFAHPVHLDANELRLLGQAGAGTAYCPVSNLHMGLEIPDLRPLRAAGLTLGLGLDHPNGNHDVLQNAKVATIAQRSAAGDPDAWTALDSLEALTVGGAAALGLEGRVGRLAVGYAADVVVLAGLLPPVLTVGRIAERVVMAGAREHVSDVVAEGRWLVRDGAVVGSDEDAIRRDAVAAQDALLAAAAR
ncbi:amidohydrolase family protein [Egicoccus sp. AB-alg2]|uniref:amidohydrolase family protein n=1 Tax=Egicoccus sp. AB-alg2 TaxID=3242693 RepID=UPI00359D6A48